MIAVASHSKGGQSTFTQKCPPPEGTTTYTNPLAVDGGTAVFAGDGRINMSLDGALSIVGDTRQISVPSSLGTGNATFILRWSMMSPRPAYDQTLPR